MSSAPIACTRGQRAEVVNIQVKAGLPAEAAVVDISQDWQLAVPATSACEYELVQGREESVTFMGAAGIAAAASTGCLNSWVAELERELLAQSPREPQADPVQQQELFSRVRAAIRVKPPSSVIASQEDDDWGEDDMSSKQPRLEADPQGRAIVSYTQAKGKRRQAFDYVLGPDSSQKEVYHTCVSRLVQNFLEGYNATLMAYGQTASGKTHTMGMAGIPEDASLAGMLPRAAVATFDHIARNSGDATSGEARYALEVQFLEVYQEDVVDLLNDSYHPSLVGGGGGGGDDAGGREDSFNSRITKSDIAIRKGEHGEVVAHNALRVKVGSFQELMDVFQRGVERRSVGATNMNDRSSRSHAIFTLMLTRTWRDARGRKLRTRSKMHLVDLAGSERQRRTGAAGQRLKESATINGALLALGKVVSALAKLDPSADVATHVPFRDSKLTRLLADSLGGKAATVMIACVSPDEDNVEESLNTLQFASRAQHIQSRQEMRTECMQDEPLASEQQVYQRVVSLLMQQHQLSWAPGARPTTGGLLDCLTEESCWQVLSAYRQAHYGPAAVGNLRLLEARSSVQLKSQDIMSALMKEVQDAPGLDLLALTARSDKTATCETPLSRFVTETAVRDKQLAEERAAAAKPRRSWLCGCFGGK